MEKKMRGSQREREREIVRPRGKREREGGTNGESVSSILISSVVIEVELLP